MYFPLITRPTRITAYKASLIDNIFKNDPLRPSISGLFLNRVFRFSGSSAEVEVASFKLVKFLVKFLCEKFV